MISTIGSCLDAQAARTPDAPAVLNTAGHVLSHADLQVARRALEIQLGEYAVTRGESIAVLMAAGPELAIVMLSVVSFATALPLDPSLTAGNIADLLLRSKATALLCDADNVGLGREAAERAGVRMLQVSSTTKFGHLVITGETLSTRTTVRGAMPANLTADEIAVLIATSGTTGRPKIIPLRHRHVLASAEALRLALSLGAADRALAVVPFWFGQGFVSTLVTSLYAGGSVVTARHLVPEQFEDWLTTLRPTWYTAPPSMHARLLEMPRDADRGHRLRFIRAAGSVLPEDLRDALERRFSAPVIDVYGLTEALGVATTPLPPTRRPEGSVGLPTSTAEVAIVDSQGALVPRGTSGEIIIRGPMVADGYVDDDAESSARFRRGWLYTGDIGRQDADGYLFVAGRAGDIINHAGQKVSPVEVEDALRSHPSVADVAVFAVPDRVNGHNVAAAVIVHPNHKVPEPLTDRELRQFASALLPGWKLPSIILFVEDLPRTSSGKVLRTQLAERVARAREQQPVVNVAEPGEPARTTVEQAVATIFARYLKKPTIYRHDDFFGCGGDSLKAMQVVEGIRDALGQALKVSTVYRWPTVAGLAEEIERWQRRPLDAGPPVVPAPRPAFVKMFYPENLDAVAVALTPTFDPVDIVVPERVILDGSPHTVESLAARCIADLDAVRPDGPYVLAGHSFAAQIAFEAAVQLRRAGREVLGVVLVDGSAPGVSLSGRRRVMGRIRFHGQQMRGQAPLAAANYGLVTTRTVLKELSGAVLLRLSRLLHRPVPASLTNTVTYSRVLSNAYKPARFDGDVLVIRATEGHPGTRDEAITDLGWGALATGQVHVAVVEGNHETILVDAGAVAIASHIRSAIERRSSEGQKRC